MAKKNQNKWVIISYHFVDNVIFVSKHNLTVLIHSFPTRRIQSPRSREHKRTPATTPRTQPTRKIPRRRRLPRQGRTPQQENKAILSAPELAARIRAKSKIGNNEHHMVEGAWFLDLQHLQRLHHASLGHSNFYTRLHTDMETR